ncbi:CocE/NonD family hydrolase [Pararobbsia silviterrae]|uniref:CocE/NonD family hydrolase n=1 Tax=Pararobbsia silviterrae TaxID=1792498 RepID=A0A494XT30_9BURK|nr:CocE/NonD family hydrolase [Pararobbsia silviterrae]RKP53790.1 CocE/NonD family hydrolase [Pararobbsia silviterrae]
MSAAIAGTEPGQRQLNGPQTTGRLYRNLSTPRYEMTSEHDVAVTMRDGVELRVDVFRPVTPGRYPVLVAASPYPRQIQNLGAPLGFIEAGASDFFVPRGYVHVIANVRGTGGSGGTFNFFDAQERRDMHDLVEWAGTQAWSDGQVGMVGISYFAMTQLEAAVEQPPHLKALFPVATTIDLYEAAMHHGLASTSFLTPYLSMIGMTSAHGSGFFRNRLIDAARRVLHLPAIHKRFETMNGEAAIAGLKVLLKLHHDPHPWDDLWRACVVEHQARDAWWDERDLLPLLDRVRVPVYLGCDWDNVPMHLPSTFRAWHALVNSPHVRVAMLGEHGLAWPWESLHIEALAWFDQWLKGRDTGILEGDPIRYWMPGEAQWRTTDTWPPRQTEHRALALRADGTLDRDEGIPGSRRSMAWGTGLNRERPSVADPATHLVWTSAPLDSDLDVVGYAELAFDAISTAPDTAWIALIQDIDPSGAITEVTAGFMRASLRKVDEAASTIGAPVLPCTQFESVPVGVTVRYRLPFVVTARRFQAGHRIRLMLTSDDQAPEIPAMLNFRHASVGTSSLNTILSSSRLILPVMTPR